jgi:hypothetical protein
LNFSQRKFFGVCAENAATCKQELDLLPALGRVLPCFARIHEIGVFFSKECLGICECYFSLYMNEFWFVWNGSKPKFWL